LPRALIVAKLSRDRDTLISGRLGRWLVVIVALALGLLALGALAFLYALLCEILIAREGGIAPKEWGRQEQERRVREGVEQAVKVQTIYGTPYGDSQQDAPWSS
jgi:hypothetical protein